MTCTILPSAAERVPRNGIAEQLATEESSAKCRVLLGVTAWSFGIPMANHQKVEFGDGLSLENEEAMHVSIAQSGVALADGGWRMVACQWCNATDNESR